MVEAGWRDISRGGVIAEPGSSVVIDTGSWRSNRPVIDWDGCTHCLICWVFCPDSSFMVAEGRLVGIDLEHCKGCGICAVECPKKCIAMVPEDELGESESHPLITNRDLAT